MKTAITLLFGIFVSLSGLVIDFVSSRKIDCLDPVYLPNSCSATNYGWITLAAGALVLYVLGILVFKIQTKSFKIASTIVLVLMIIIVAFIRYQLSSL